MLIKPIFIEITGLEGSGKTSLINMLKENNNFSYFKYIDESNIYKYKSKNKFFRIIDRTINILKNFKFNMFLLILLAKNKDLQFFLPIDFYTNYKYKQQLDEKYDIYICDEFLLNLLFDIYIGKYSHNYVSVNNIDTILDLFTNISIYPIHIKTDYDVHIKRIKERDDSSYEKLNDDEKKEILEKKGYLSEYIVKKYCEKQEIPFIEISGDLELPDMYDTLRNEINYILQEIKEIEDKIKQM